MTRHRWAVPPLEEQLLEAVNVNVDDVDAVCDLLAHGASPDARCEDGEPLSFVAIADDQVAVVDALLGRGCSLDPREALMRVRGEAMLHCLLEHGLDINAAGADDKSTALYSMQTDPRRGFSRRRRRPQPCDRQPRDPADLPRELGATSRSSSAAVALRDLGELCGARSTSVIERSVAPHGPIAAPSRRLLCLDIVSSHANSPHKRAPRLPPRLGPRRLLEEG